MNMYQNKLLRQVFRFLAVGGSAFLVDFSVLWLLAERMEINYLLANCISFTASVIYNYILSTIWVFKSKSYKNKYWEFLVFLLLSLVGLGINQGIMWMTVEIAGINYLYSKILATAIVMLFNFITRKLFLES